MAVTYDFQTPGVSTSAADTQEDIRNIAEMSWVWHVNASPHSLTNKPTGLIEAFYDSTVDFSVYPGGLPNYGYQNYYSLKAFDGTNLGNVNFGELYVNRNGAVLSNTVGIKGREIILMGLTAGYACESTAQWIINADYGNTGTSTFDPILSFYNQATERARIYTDTSDSHKLKFDVGGSDHMVIDSSGKVGIGTSSPSHRLHVVDNTAVYPQTLASFGNSDENSSFRIVSASNTAWGLQSYNSRDIIFENRVGSGTPSRLMTIKNDGKVGIGTSAPSSPLHVKAANNIIMSLQSSDATVGNLYFNFRNDDGDEKGWIGYGSSTTDDFGIFNNESRDLNLGTSGATRLQIKSAGDVEVKTGNLVIGTSGKGIDFSATSDAAGATSELLDDYEEGTFTPTLSTTGTNFTSVTYDASRSGSYTKIGRTVFFTIFMGTDAITKGSASGGITVAGLPFTSNSTLGVGRSVVRLTASNFLADAPIVGTITENTSYIQLSKRATSVSGDTALQVADIGTGANANFMSISGSYQI